MTRCVTTLILFHCCALLAPWCAADMPLEQDEDRRIVAFGDFRTRLEADWDSRQSDGSKRDDRTRLRIRARLGADFHVTDDLIVQLRVATGSNDNQQSTNITVADFNGNNTGDAHINFDRYYLKKTFAHGHLWVGKNTLPFWRQNGIFWDDDTPVAGFGVNYKIALDKSSLSFNTGYFSLPVGMQDFAGNLGLGQAVYQTKISDVALTVSGGVLVFDADPDDSDATSLLDNNGSRDYTIWVTSGQAQFDFAGKPLSVGFDYMYNSKNYDSVGSDAFTSFHRNETDAWHIQAIWGETRNKWDWQAGFMYSRVEMFGIHNSYSQDDSVRWSANSQARISNFKGPELRAGLGLGNSQKLIARLFLVEAIRKRKAGDPAKEDGNRFRIDYSIAF